MTNQVLIKSDQCCLAELKAEDHWVRLRLSLTEEFTGGELVRLGEHVHFSVEGTDELSSAYSRVNWMSGVASGVFYAFRALKIQRQYTLLREFAGRLRSSDMETVARCSALAVARLANRELPALPTEGWEVHLEVFERSPTNGSQPGLGDRVPTGHAGDPPLEANPPES